MDLSSITGFFYNILPGIYFLLLFPSSLKLICSILLVNKSLPETTFLILFLATCLLLGFVFQGLTKLVRETFLDDLIIDKVIRDNDKGKIWKTISNVFKVNHLIDKDEDNIQYFYLMDNYINAIKKNILPTHFSARTSLWANLVWANLFLLIFTPTLLLKSFSAIFLMIALKVAWLNFKAQQDTILKTFLMLKIFPEDIKQAAEQKK